MYCGLYHQGCVSTPSGGYAVLGLPGCPGRVGCISTVYPLSVVGYNDSVWNLKLSLDSIQRMRCVGVAGMPKGMLVVSAQYIR